MSIPDKDGFRFVPYDFEVRPEDQMLARAESFYAEMDGRRSVRDFSDRPVDRRLIELAIMTASTAPSGAHMQPWRFVAVSDPQVKRRIRLAAEQEERELYQRRIGPEWERAIKPLGTDEHKPHLEVVPWLVVLFEVVHGQYDTGEKKKHYYVKESVGIAAGMFIAALHRIGLATLTHTPSPMGFLREILGRPDNERPFVLFPVGYPADGVCVPDLTRKPLDEVAVFDPTPVD